MIEESATVLACDEDFAFVETQVQAACGACQAQSGCSTSVLSGLFKRRNNRLKVLNPIQAKPGQRVIIGIQEQALVSVSLVAYLLPLLSLILGAVGIQEATEYWQWQGGELGSILGGLSGLIIGLYLVRSFSYRHQHDQSYQAVILRQVPDIPIHFS
jgi:sigma-E factor negative regulatory protein RseC